RLCFEIFIRIFPHLYTDPPDRLPSLKVGNPDQCVEVSHLYMNMKGGYLRKKPVWLLFPSMNGGTGRNGPRQDPRLSGNQLSDSKRYGSRDVADPGAGKRRQFFGRFSSGCKCLVFEIDPIDIACKNGHIGLKPLLQDRHVLVEAQLGQQMVGLQRHVNSFDKRPSKYIFEAFGFGSNPVFTERFE